MPGNISDSSCYSKKSSRSNSTNYDSVENFNIISSQISVFLFFIDHFFFFKIHFFSLFNLIYKDYKNTIGFGR